MMVVGVIKLIESDKSAATIDTDSEAHFGEDANEQEMRDLRTLNPNLRSHREEFAEECDVLLEVHNLEDELNNVELCNDRVALENTDKRIT